MKKREKNSLISVQDFKEVNREGEILIPALFLGGPLIFLGKNRVYVVCVFLMLMNYTLYLLCSKKIYNVSQYLNNGIKIVFWTLILYLDAIIFLFKATTLDGKRKIIFLGIAFLIQIIVFALCILFMRKRSVKKKIVNKQRIYLSSLIGTLLGMQIGRTYIKSISQGNIILLLSVLFF